jgi:hypothetical protein
LQAIHKDLHRELEKARATKWVDKDPINKECWEVPNAKAGDLWLETALARGATMQPWARRSVQQGVTRKARVLRRADLHGQA